MRELRTLADVMPAVVSALDSRPESPIPADRDVVLLLVDGLGAELLQHNRDIAPALAGCMQGSVVAGFPATTASSLTTLATGSPCASHGIIGYSFAVPGDDGPRLLNALRWRLDSAEGVDARDLYVPEVVQRSPSLFETLASQGIAVHYVMPPDLEGSALTRAAFRATGTTHAAKTLDQLRDGILDAVGEPGVGQRFVYAYYPKLDATGHARGPESPEWRKVLQAVDRAVAQLLFDLPSTVTLVVTGDHGMIEAGAAIDLDSDAALTSGVRLVAGEARVRHIYVADPHSVAAIAQQWASALDGYATIVTREQAIDENWYGAVTAEPVVRQRIGDFIAVGEGRTVLLCPDREPKESVMRGHHGARTDDEQLVPLIVARGSR